MGKKRERDVEADADSEAPPQKALRRTISPEPGSTDRRTHSFPDASADNISSVESEREYLVKERRFGHDCYKLNEDGQVEKENEGDNCVDKHGDYDDDDDDDESVQAESGGNDDKEVRSDGSEDRETEKVNIDESEVKETDNEA